MPKTNGICANVNNSSVQTALVHETDKMSSLEIANVTGQRHSDVLRSIRNMEDAWVKVSGRKFALAEYTDEQGKQRPCYKLTKEECLYVATKFNDEARARLIIRWSNLETGKAQPIAKQPKKPSCTPTRVKASLEWVKGVSELLNLNDSSKLLLLGKVAKPLELPLPDYTPSKGVLKSASELLKERGLQISSREFNTRAIEKGFLCEMERKSKHGAKKFFKSITKKGLSFGENQVSPHNPNSTQPHWYVEKFDELLSLVGIQMTGGLLNGK